MRDNDEYSADARFVESFEFGRALFIHAANTMSGECLGQGDRAVRKFRPSAVYRILKMELKEVWPLFELEIETPRLLLTPVRDSDLPGLCEAALAGIHDAEYMPFGFPWTDAQPEELKRNLATFHWGLRSSFSPRRWTIAFAVRIDDSIVGSIDLVASDFEDRETVGTGSWLTRKAQGDGIGTEMRSALLMFAFDYLGAKWAESSAAVWNEASLGVSRKLGYKPNGVSRANPRPGEPVDEQRLRLNKGDFQRPSWKMKVRGADAALEQLGLGNHRTVSGT